MKAFSYKNVEAQEVADQEAKGVKIRAVITNKDGAPNFAMRVFEVEPQGYTPFHSHPWEHEIFIKSGEGKLAGEKATKNLSPGDVVFIAPGEKHQFVNTGSSPFEFLCLVPNEGHCV